jgi:protein disulfide-isomerase A1
VFSYADLNVPDNNRLSEYLGVKASEQPAVVIVDPRGDLKKFRLESRPSVEAVKNFVVDWKNGKVSSYLKSEPVPKQEYDGNVRVLVGKNFDEVVYDTSKDVLVEFYAPWCGHCKSLAPDYEKLAAEFRNSNVVIAKMDATANEAKGVAVKGFPTIRFYSANNKKPEDFNGDRNFEGLKKFVLEKANAKAKVESREAEGKVEL